MEVDHGNRVAAGKSVVSDDRLGREPRPCRLGSAIAVAPRVGVLPAGAGKPMGLIAVLGAPRGKFRFCSLQDWS